MIADLDRLFEIICDACIPVDPVDDFSLELEDESYDDFLFSGSNLYGGF